MADRNWQYRHHMANYNERYKWNMGQMACIMSRVPEWSSLTTSVPNFNQYLCYWEMQQDPSDESVDESEFDAFRYMHIPLTSFLPFVLIRLHRDHGSFDFLDWSNKLMVGNTPLSMLYQWYSNHEANAHVFKDLAPKSSLVLDGSDTVQYFMCLLLHKVKARVCLSNMANARLLQWKLPPEILHYVQIDLATSPMKKCQGFMQDIRKDADLYAWATKLDAQIRKLVHCIEVYNSFFWPMFTCAPSFIHLDLKADYLGSFMDRSADAAHEALIASFDAFAETPGALKGLLRRHLGGMGTTERVIEKLDWLHQFKTLAYEHHWDRALSKYASSNCV